MATGSEWTQGQEYQAEEEDQEQFAKLRDKDLHKHLHGMATLPKGKGKETGNGNVKRKKAGAKDSWLLKMAPWMMMRKEKRKNLMMTAKKDPWDEAKNKARIARDLCQGAANNLEESLTKAKGANRLSKGHKKDAEDLLVESAKVIDKLKAFLVKRPANMTLQQAKDMTIHASTVTKNLKGHKKDLDLLSSKALSRCSSKW